MPLVSEEQISATGTAAPSTAAPLDAWLDYISGQHWQSMDLGLDRMRTLVARLDLQVPASRVLTVAGTNGKGTSCLMAEKLLLAHGRTVGTTLSPHVHRFNERIRVHGAELDDEAIVAALAAVDAARGETPLTYFEFGALAALWCFKQHGVEVAILEIGLGGTLDAFNVIDADVAVITSIGLDHQQFLGDDTETIGAAKAGILRAGQQVVLGPAMPSSVLAACSDLGLQPRQCGSEFHASRGCDDSTTWTYADEHERVTGLAVTAGAPQNLAVAYNAARAVDATVDAAALRQACELTNLPGRLERRTFEVRHLLLDVAHNPAGIDFLLRELDARELAPALVVCGMLHDKDHAGVLESLVDRFAAPLLLTGTRGERAMTAAALAEAVPARVRARVVGAVEATADLPAALLAHSAPGDLVLVVGSFDVVAQATIGRPSGSGA